MFAAKAHRQPVRLLLLLALLLMALGYIGGVSATAVAVGDGFPAGTYNYDQSSTSTTSITNVALATANGARPPTVSGGRVLAVSDFLVATEEGAAPICVASTTGPGVARPVLSTPRGEV